ncbi:MAG: DNA gyrase subunit A, partial [Chitinophagia bacterium]|nr:DNA gyrase subunit A [Chitinophagia bacterium]
NQLYKYTELQTSYGINNVAITKGRPCIMNLKMLITEFIDFRMDVVIRRTRFELRKAEERAHILAGYLKALDHLDEVIATIRASRTPEEAKSALMEKSREGNWVLNPAFLGDVPADIYTEEPGFSEAQTKAILELRLQRLTGMEQDKIIEEITELIKTIQHLRGLLSNEASRYDLIVEELTEVREKFGDDRKSEIQYLADEMRIEDLIEDEDVIITISHLGYIKRTSASEYRAQKRGGRGAVGSKTREEDFVEHLFVASTHGTMMFFTEKGRCYWLRVYEIPDGEKQSKGRAIQNLIQLPNDDKVKAIIDVNKLEDKAYVEQHYIVLCTKKGIIKKTSLEDFSRPRASGVNAITVVEGDELMMAKLTDGNQEIMLAVKSGRAIRFPENKVRPTGRGAIGVAGIEVDDEKDEVVGMICIHKDDPSRTILVVSEQGFGKRTSVEEYRITNRGGKGVKTINVTEKTGSLVGLLSVTEKEDLIITCKSGITIRTGIEQIREAGRATQGVKLIRLDEGDEIAAISQIDEQDDTPVEVGNSNADTVSADASNVLPSDHDNEQDNDIITPNQDNTPQQPS